MTAPALGWSGERIRFDQAGGVLMASRCQACGETSWPPRAACARCGNGQLVSVELPRVGEVMTWTRVWIPVEGVEPPYVLAIVRLGVVSVVGHLRNVRDGQIPTRVALQLDTSQRPPFWFVPRVGDGDTAPS